MRKRSARIERQRSQRRKDCFGKILVNVRPLYRCQLRIIHDAQTSLLKGREELPAQTLVCGFEQIRSLFTDRAQLLFGRHTIGIAFEYTALHLPLKTGYPHHKELIQV